MNYIRHALGDERERRIKILTFEDLKMLNKEAEENEKNKQKKGSPSPPTVKPAPIIKTLEDYVILEGISCYDGQGNVVEHYDRLAVARDVAKKQVIGNDRATKLVHASFRPYDAILNFEQQGNGLFLPSFALTCNIISCLYDQRSNPEIKAVLDQYNDYGHGYGWHAQNTLVNWEKSTIIHYPNDSDFTSAGGAAEVNKSSQRTALKFNKENIADIKLKHALAVPNYKEYIQNLTGLKEPEILLDIGKYFNKTARVWISSQSFIRSTWIGCSSVDSFSLGAGNRLNGTDGARGVRKNFSIGNEGKK